MHVASCKPYKTERDTEKVKGETHGTALKPRLHDTTCCQWGCQTGCQTGLTTPLTTGCIVYTAGCQTGLTTGLTTGWMFVYTIQPVVKPVVQTY